MRLLFLILLCCVLQLQFNCVVRGNDQTKEFYRLNDNNYGKRPLPNFINYHIDSAKSSNLDSIVIQYKRGLFKENNKDVPNLGYNHCPAWFHIPLVNEGSAELLSIELDFANYNSVELYILDTLFNVISVQQKGIYNLSKFQSDAHRCPLFEVKFTRGLRYHLFFKIENEAPVLFPLTFHSNRTLLSKENIKRGISFTLLGVIIATVIFNLIFFIITVNKSYLFLALHLLFLFGNFFFYFGYGPEVFPHIEPQLLLMFKFDFYNLSAIFHGLFFVYYLSLFNYKYLFRIELVLIGFFTLFFIATSTQMIPVYNVAIITIYSYFIASIIGVVIAVIVLARKERSALYYISAFGVHIAAAIVFFLTTVGVMKYSELNLSIQMIATAIFGIVLSIGLTEQFTISNKIKAANIQLEKDKVLLISEIDDRKRIESDLIESESKFKKLFELLPHPLILTDFETGSIIDVNTCLCKISGYTKNELIGYPTPKIGFWRQEDRDEFTRELRQTGRINAKEMTIFLKDKTSISVLMYSEIIELRSLKRIFTVVVDVSEIRRQEKILADSEIKLRELNATKDKFFSVIAHDLQNPMQVLLACSKELQSSIKDENIIKIKKYADTINTISENTTGLIQNLLSWSRIQTKLMKFRPQQILAKDLLCFTENLFSGIAKAKGVTVKYNCPSDLILFADRNMIDSVLRNLVSNAVKFTYNGGLVTVELSWRENNFEIIVNDTGIGMSEQTLEHLFRIGENIKSIGTNSETGSGLGLILCNEFIKLHNGTIQVESIKGKGSKFIVKWPNIYQHEKESHFIG